MFLNIERIRFCKGSALLDELKARLGLVPHELLNNVRSGGFVRFEIQAIKIAAAARNIDAQQRALFRIHRRFFELRGHHLTQAFEAADFQLAAPAEQGRLQLLKMCIVSRISRFASLAEAVKRRHSEKKMPVSISPGISR